MSEKQDLYPQMGDIPGAPPQYDAATAPNDAQGGFVPAAPPIQAQQVIMQNAPIMFGPNPMAVVCPSCHEQNITSVKYEPNMKTHLIATLLCVFTCCCCIPYMIDSCQSANHHCAHCGAYLGTYNK